MRAAGDDQPVTDDCEIALGRQARIRSAAVVPVAFAGILAQAGLSSFQYLLYISLFVLFYMLDEIIVFLIAFFTMKIWLASSKIVTWAALLESIILFILGAYYLFNIF